MRINRHRRGVGVPGCMLRGNLVYGANASDCRTVPLAAGAAFGLTSVEWTSPVATLRPGRAFSRRWLLIRMVRSLRELTLSSG